MKESRRVPIFQRGKKNPPENYKNLSLIIMEHNHEQNYETFGTLQQTHIFFETIGFNAVQYFYQKQNYLLADGVFVRDMSASIYKMLQVKKKTIFAIYFWTTIK